MIIASVVLVIFVANALVALQIKRILVRVAGISDITFSRRGAVWRYRIASFLALVAAALVFIAVLAGSR